jgi:DNA-binding NarL/FixJ family response regulator
MNILLLEDDPQQSATLVGTLKSHYRDADIQEIDREADLYALLGNISAGDSLAPDLVIADVMFPWTRYTSGPLLERPERVKEEGFSRAGVRCLEKFRETVGDQIPWVFFSVLEPDMISNEVKHSGRSGRTLYLSKEIGVAELLTHLDPLVKR